MNIETVYKAQSGDSHAFRVLFQTYRDKVTRTAFLILRDYQLAEDIVQETFLQVHLKLNKLSDPKAFESWLYRITVNLCYEKIRKAKKSKLSSLENLIELDTENWLVDSKTPEDIAVEKAFQLQLLQAIYSLPRKYSIILVLYYYNNFSLREIGEIVGSSEGTIKSRLNYARKSLEKVLSSQQISALDIPTGGDTFENRQTYR